MGSGTRPRVLWGQRFPGGSSKKLNGVGSGKEGREELCCPFCSCHPAAHALQDGTRWEKSQTPGGGLKKKKKKRLLF